MSSGGVMRFEPYGPPASSAAAFRELDATVDEATVLRRENHGLRSEKAGLQACLEAERAEVARLRSENQRLNAAEGDTVFFHAQCPCGSVMEIRSELGADDYDAIRDWEWAHEDCDGAAPSCTRAPAAGERPTPAEPPDPAGVGQPTSLTTTAAIR